MMLRILLTVMLFVAVGVGGCAKDDPTPGEQLDQTIEEAGDAAEDMADEAEDAADEAENALD